MKIAAENPPISLLGTRRYRLFWFSSLLSNIGTWMQQVAQPWVILSLSHSSFLVGLDSFILSAPGWIFTLWGGVLADRMDRKSVILFFQAIQFLCILLLLFLLVVGQLQVWMILLASFVIGCTDSLSMPSYQSIIPSLVAEKEIPRAVALNSTQFNLSRMLGPAFAGVLMVKFGAVACFSANAFSFIPFFLSILWIYPKKLVPPKPAAEAERAPAVHLSEFKTILANPLVRWPLATTFTTNSLCAPLITFCPVLIQQVFHAEVGEFGSTMAAFGMGGLLGAGFSLLPFPKFLNRHTFATAVGLLLGALLIIVALNHSLLVLTGLMILAGMALTITNISVGTFLQTNASNQNRGRVVSLSQLALQGGISAGGLITGFSSSQLGISRALFLNGSAAVALQILILLRTRKSGLENYGKNGK